MAAESYLNELTTTSPSYSPILSQGDWLTSPSGAFSAAQQNDGNFVVYYGTNPGGPVLWSSNTPQPSSSTINYATWVSPYGNLANQAFVSISSFPPYSTTTAPPNYFLSKSGGTTGSYYASLGDDGRISVFPGTSGNATGSATVQSPKTDKLGSITLTQINYDLDHVGYNSDTKQYGTSTRVNNSTATQQTDAASVALNYVSTQTFNWNVTDALAASISTTEKISVPGITDVSATESLTQTTTLSAGQSTTSTESQTYTNTSNITVPPFSTYAVTAVGEKVDASIPYSYVGVGHYASGVDAPVAGTGVFEGVDTGVFDVEISCVQTPGGCPTSLSSSSPTPEPLAGLAVPEPSAALILNTVLAMTALVRARRRIGTGLS